MIYLNRIFYIMNRTFGLSMVFCLVAGIGAQSYFAVTTGEFAGNTGVCYYVTEDNQNRCDRWILDRRP